VTGYTNSALAYTVSAADGLVSGKTYAFRLTATNSLSSGSGFIAGTSEPSEELIVAAASPIAQPAAPTRTLSKSTRTALYITWAESTATEIPVMGYLLYMAEGTAGDFKLVYNGTFNALQRHFTAEGLTVGTLYQFKVEALNFNHPLYASPASPLLSVHACVAPSPSSAVRRVVGDRTSITLAWQAPSDDGGCSLTGYQLMRGGGGGATGPVTTEVDASSVNGRPALTEHQVTLASSFTGTNVRFQLISHNAEASSYSSISEFIIAAVPGKPPALTFRYLETPYLT
jgi:hypothetical protein